VIRVKAWLYLMGAVLIASAVSGCSASAPSAKTIDVPMDQVMNQSAIARDATLAVGDTLKISLGSNHTTPYRWTDVAKIDDPAILSQASHQYLRPDTDRMGAPGTEVWTFKALKAGTTTIFMGYVGIVGGTAPTCTFTANVTVK
jgi:inhibitor of cysteine peptidase